MFVQFVALKKIVFSTGKGLCRISTPTSLYDAYNQSFSDYIVTLSLREHPHYKTFQISTLVHLDLTLSIIDSGPTKISHRKRLFVVKYKNARLDNLRLKLKLLKSYENFRY